MMPCVGNKSNNITVQITGIIDHFPLTLQLITGQNWQKEVALASKLRWGGSRRPLGLKKNKVLISVLLHISSKENTQNHQQNKETHTQLFLCCRKQRHHIAFNLNQEIEEFLHSPPPVLKTSKQMRIMSRRGGKWGTENLDKV